MRIQILVDNPSSWFIPYANELHEKLLHLKHSCLVIHDHKDIVPSDILFLLSCEKIIKKNILDQNRHNIVVHGSALPEGKGWSPLTWQILEGKSIIPITLFEASESVDAGPVYIRDQIELKGTELNEKLKTIQGKKIVEMCVNYVNSTNTLAPQPQSGNETFYKKRTAKDSLLDVNKPLVEQMNLLRVCDNERYPAFFYYMDKKYIIKIYEEE